MSSSKSVLAWSHENQRSASLEIVMKTTLYYPKPMEYRYNHSKNLLNNVSAHDFSWWIERKCVILQAKIYAITEKSSYIAYFLT